MPTEDGNSANLQELNQEIYKHSLELAVVNKTLSLLRKLYQISLLSLDPASLSEKVSDTIRVDLNMETVGIYLFEEETNLLTPFKFSKSERFEKAVKAQKLNLDELKIKDLSADSKVGKVITAKTSEVTDNLKDVWGSLADAKQLAAIKDGSHIKTTLLYPLVMQDKVIGMLLLSLNREYEILSDFEKDAIASLIDVVAVAIDKALLYEKLKEANEQLKILDKARAEFISIASHQLRTPPATIKWYLGAILDGDFGTLTEDLKAALQRTNVTNDSQIATIDDLLNASRIERGKLEFFFEENPLEPVVTTLVEQMQPLAQMKKMTIEYTKPSQVFPNIMMDKEKVRQVLNNMIDNAIKYSNSGAIGVSLAQEGENLVVKVKDNGKGIAPAELKSIFEKYMRGHDSVTHATGLGLGMYVAKVIIEQHNGKIWAESEGAGKGSTFCFSLPLHSAVRATTVDLAQPAEPTEPTAPTK
jgi:signal transduction histidine kinase